MATSIDTYFAALMAGETTEEKLLASVQSGKLSAKDYGEILKRVASETARQRGGDGYSVKERVWQSPDGPVPMLDVRGSGKPIGLSPGKARAVVALIDRIKAFADKHPAA